MIDILAQTGRKYTSVDFYYEGAFLSSMVIPTEIWYKLRTVLSAGCIETGSARVIENEEKIDVPRET